MKLNRIFILGACSITFLASCGCSNNNDQKVLDEVNKILIDNASSINTCHDAVKKVEENKIELNEHKFSNENYEFVYDSKAKQFVIMDGDNIVRTSSGYTRSANTLDYFKSVFVYNPNSKYSQYLDKRAEVPEQLLITTGFDIGDHIDIPNIAYTNLSNNPHDVIVRTYSDYFSVLAPLDTVHHYEIANNVIVTDIATLDMHASTAYINAKNGYIYFAEDSSTDFFEVDQEAKKVDIDIEDGAEFYAAVNIKYTKSGDPIPVVLSSKSVSSATELQDALNDDSTYFIRLAHDINYSNEIDLGTLSKSICLDLAGYKITFDSISSGTAINVTDGNDFYILDSQGVLDNNSGIDLYDCHISIYSGASKSSTLMVNGGKITQTINSNDVDDYSAAIECVGDYLGTGSNISSNFMMYGGKIEAKMTDGSISSSCVASFGKGANVKIVYGTLVSDAGCIACNPGDYSNLGESTLEINGGFFTAGLKTRGVCIEYGVAVNLLINGGTFTGDTCLTLKSGTAKVTNATFNALGQYRPQYFGADGSAINIYKNGVEELDLEIADSFIYSNFAYVLSAQDGASANVTFNDGLYSYYLDGAVNIPEEGIAITIVNPDNFIQHSL